jgi:hypothetical protein
MFELEDEFLSTREEWCKSYFRKINFLVNFILFLIMYYNACLVLCLYLNGIAFLIYFFYLILLEFSSVSIYKGL